MSPKIINSLAVTFPSVQGDFSVVHPGSKVDASTGAALVNYSVRGHTTSKYIPMVTVSCWRSGSDKCIWTGTCTVFAVTDAAKEFSSVGTSPIGWLHCHLSHGLLLPLGLKLTKWASAPRRLALTLPYQPVFP